MVLLPEECKTFGDPGAALGMWLAMQLVTGAQALEDGQMIESELRRRLNVVIATVIDRPHY
jgi:hypothetical protein